MRIDLGRLTHEETVALLRDVISELSSTDVIEVICQSLSADDRAELMASLEVAAQSD